MKAVDSPLTPAPKQKGYLMLSEVRSGSNWLGSLARAVDTMGLLEEWLVLDFLESQTRPVDGDRLLELILEKASTSNGRFAIKIFPGQLYKIKIDYGFDFIRACLAEHDTAIFVVKRRDRMRQAVSVARAQATGQWRSTQNKKASPQYDFNMILRAFYYIEQSYRFWDNYLTLLDQPYILMHYEDLLPDPSPFLTEVARHLDVSPPQAPTSELSIQRDNLTEEWVERFRMDIETNDIVLAAGLRSPASRNLSNLCRFFRKEITSPFPFHL